MSTATRLAAGTALLCWLVAVPGCRPESADAELREARRQLRLGNLAAALARAEKGCADWGDRTNSAPYWQFRLLKGEIMLARGRMKEGWLWLEPAPPDRPEFREIAASRLLNRGFAKFLFAEYAEAKRVLDDARAQLPSGSTSVVSAEIDLREGAVLTRLGDLDGAEQAFRRALRIATRVQDDYMRAAALGNLGFHAMHRYRYDEAIPWFEQSRLLSEKVGARKFTATTFGNLGRCYYQLGDLDRAIELQIRAEALAAEVGDNVGRQIWLSSLGDVYLNRREFREAISYFEKALALSRQMDETYTAMAALSGMTAASLAAGDLVAARRYNEAALTIEREAPIKNLRGLPWIGAGRIAEAEGDVDKAEQAYRRTFAAAVENGNEGTLWQARAGLAHVATTRRRWAEAENEFQAALASLERARSRLARDEWKLSFHWASVAFYHEYVAFLIDRGRTERALDVAESSRARMLAQKLGILEAMRPAPNGRFRDLAARLDAVLVSVWLAPEHSIMWLVTPQKVYSFPLPGEPEMRGLVEAYLGAIRGQRDPIATENPAARRLSELLLAPIAKAAPGARRVVLVPDGCLHRVNLESLPVGSGRPHYWVEDVTVALAPSLALVSPRQGGKARHEASLLLIGNPAPPPGEFPALPEIEKEVENVRRTFAPSRATVFTGLDATPEIYREAGPGRFSFIHFAAHATANQESPLDSAVILSPKNEAYKLYARDIIGVPLQADLVTISACRGAGSRVYSGEGLVGFAWAFLQAGARNVVAGLWDVSDRSTSLLMQQLYAEISAGRSPAAALRAAKLRMLAGSGSYQKPYYWAPFQVFARTPAF
jgi:CHAT domain-containing protein/Tfp pilus assembly protein PilF